MQSFLHSKNTLITRIDKVTAYTVQVISMSYLVGIMFSSWYLAYDNFSSTSFIMTHACIECF